MFNGSSFIANSTVDVYKSTKSKTAKGSFDRVFTKEYENLTVRIEHQELEAPVNISGRMLRTYYLMQVWKNTVTKLLPALKEGYRILDTDTEKTYEVVEIQAGSLFKDKQYKLECKMLVMNDERFTNFIKRM